jgi:hypothetical protein
MASPIERWLGVEHGGRAELWAGMQLDHDMWRVRQKAIQSEVTHVYPPRPHKANGGKLTLMTT